MSRPEDEMAHDDYVGEPNYPDPWTTRQPKEGLRDIDAARIVCLAPDVCLTPIGDTAVPIPYQIVDYAGHDAGYTESVRFTGKKAMTLASRTTHVHGDAPGTKKGVKSGTVEDVTEPIGHAPEVRAEGHPVIRHLDRFHMNSRNTVGEAIYVKDTAGYEPPVDDDPVPGSLFMVTVTPAQMEQPAQQQQGNTLAGSGSGSAKISVPPSAPSLGRLGTFGRLLGRMGKVAGPLMALLEGADPAGTDITRLARKAATDALVGVTPRNAEEQALFNETRARVASHIEEAFLNPFTSRDEEYIQSERDYLEEILERKPEKDPQPAPVPPLGPPGNVRVDEDPDRKCRTLIICFMPRTSSIDRKEFERQMELQQDGLNRMTPQQMLDNRSRYLADPKRMRALSKPLQDQARRQYLTTQRIQNKYRNEYGILRGPIELQNYVKAAAALHNPDMVAGGSFNSVVDPRLPVEDRVGRRIENSSMGSQWVKPKRNENTRTTRLVKHATQQAKNNCPTVQVDLRLCESMPNEPGKPKTEQ